MKKIKLKVESRTTVTLYKKINKQKIEKINVKYNTLRDFSRIKPMSWQKKEMRLAKGRRINEVKFHIHLKRLYSLRKARKVGNVFFSLIIAVKMSSCALRFYPTFLRKKKKCGNKAYLKFRSH